MFWTIFILYLYFCLFSTIREYSKGNIKEILKYDKIILAVKNLQKPGMFLSSGSFNLYLAGDT